jgi:hypothetical protein
MSQQMLNEDAEILFLELKSQQDEMKIFNKRLKQIFDMQTNILTQIQEFKNLTRDSNQLESVKEMKRLDKLNEKYNRYSQIFHIEDDEDETVESNEPVSNEAISNEIEAVSNETEPISNEIEAVSNETEAPVRKRKQKPYITKKQKDLIWKLQNLPEHEYVVLNSNEHIMFLRLFKANEIINSFRKIRVDKETRIYKLHKDHPDHKLTDIQFLIKREEEKK